ncbi:hypothetical protein PVK06_016532 [Gossypium arboreum]|uniref:Uncharacterized protein n=1 Tax=Gossypium arboreum TaxID=29729 RepID=A0ABR0Q0Y7_GOSAR|nr:hypothetical protein PVK06_016532 [Gossypium arboreum]
MSSYVEGPASLNDALNKGLSPSSDWSTRVAAFTYLRSLLQQGPKGIQEVVQDFEKVRKLFFQHLDDPHHKVAQRLLCSYGVKTQGVDNSKGALDLIASGAKFGFIIINMILLVLNSFEMLGVTACLEESGRQVVLAANVDVFIEKPLDPQHLVPILKELDEW